VEGDDVALARFDRTEEIADAEAFLVGLTRERKALDLAGMILRIGTW